MEGVFGGRDKLGKRVNVVTELVEVVVVELEERN